MVFFDRGAAALALEVADGLVLVTFAFFLAEPVTAGVVAAPAVFGVNGGSTSISLLLSFRFLEVVCDCDCDGAGPATGA